MFRTLRFEVGASAGPGRVLAFLTGMYLTHLGARIPGMVGLSLILAFHPLPASGQSVIPDSFLQLQRQFLPARTTQDTSRFNALSFVMGLLNQGLDQGGDNPDQVDMGAAEMMPGQAIPSTIGAGITALGHSRRPGESLIVAFQKAEGLAADGVAGPVTLSRLILRLEEKRGGAAGGSVALDHECATGLYSSGSECRSFEIPDNGKLTEDGHWWTCESGYRPDRGGCSQIVIPANAQLNRMGTGWECSPGYSYRAGRCAPIRVPTNGRLDAAGNGWVCEIGFRRLGNRCAAEPARGEPDSSATGPR